MVGKIRYHSYGAIPGVALKFVMFSSFTIHIIMSSVSLFTMYFSVQFYLAYVMLLV